MQSSTVTAKTAPLSGTVVAEVLRLSRYEWFRMRRRPAFAVLCTLAALSILIPVAVAAIFVNLDFFSDGNGGSGESLKAAFGFSASPFNSVSMCIGALAFGADFGAGGYRALHMRGASRMAVPLSKVIYFLVVLAALLAAGWILSLLVSNLATLISVGSAYSCSDCIDSLAQIGRALPGIVFWSLMGAGLAFWGRSTTFGVGVGFGYYFLSNIVQPALSLGFSWKWDFDIGSVLHWLPDNLVVAFFNADSTHVSHWLSGLGILAYCAVIVTFILWLSRARDLTPSS